MISAPPPTTAPFLDEPRLADLLTSTLSLPEIAAELGTPFSDLFTFLTSPEGDAFVHSLTTLHTQRARLAASALIPKVISTLKSTLDHYDTHVQAGTATDRHHDHARKSCTLLLRLSRGMGSPGSMGLRPMNRGTGLWPVAPSPSSPPTSPSSPLSSSAFGSASSSPPPRSSASSAYGSAASSSPTHTQRTPHAPPVPDAQSPVPSLSPPRPSAPSPNLRDLPPRPP